MRIIFADLSRTPLIRPPRRPTEVKRDPTEKECTFFTKTVCLEAADYPQYVSRVTFSLLFFHRFDKSQQLRNPTQWLAFKWNFLQRTTKGVALIRTAFHNSKDVIIRGVVEAEGSFFAFPRDSHTIRIVRCAIRSFDLRALITVTVSRLFNEELWIYGDREGKVSRAIV